MQDKSLVFVTHYFAVKTKLDVMGNIVENNNSFTKFSQVWSHFVFTDNIPVDAPVLDSAQRTEKFLNADKTYYTARFFQITNDNDAWDYLLHVSNFQLTKEFRQGRSWKLELNGEEESLRAVILPGTTVSRTYTPSFTDGSYSIPYTSVDPDFDFENCRINVGLDFSKLYFTGWIYIGKTFQTLLQKELKLPFASYLWLLKDQKTGNKVKFEISKEATYKLPADEFDDTEDSDTIVTTNIINQVLNKHGRLDEGEVW